MDAWMKEIYSILFDTPLLMAPGDLSLIESSFYNALRTHQPGQEMRAAGEGDPRRGGYVVENGIAMFGIYGLLVNRRMGWWNSSTQYSDIVAAKDAALSDARVKALFFDIDSGGGEASGAFDAAENLFNSRGQKPMYAMVNENALSGGYILGAAIGNVIVPRTASVGSVGVISTHFDWSKMEEEMGLSVEHIIAGERKADFSPHKPLSSEAREILQSGVNTSWELFIDAIARYRKMSATSVRETQAGIFTGPAAVQIGFADTVASVDSVLSAISGANGTAVNIRQISQTTPKKEAKAMNIEDLKKDHPALAEQIEAAARQGYITQAVSDAAIATAVTTATEASTATIVDQLTAARQEGVDSVIAVHDVIADPKAGAHLAKVMATGVEPAKLKELGITGAALAGSQTGTADAILAAISTNTPLPAGQVTVEEQQNLDASASAGRVAALANGGGRIKRSF